MAFFRNDTVNLLNLHYGLRALVMSGAGTFYAVFLLRAGVPAPMVLAALALILLGRFCIRPLILPAARRWGLKPLVIAGSLITALQYPVLAEVHGVGGQLLLLCAVSAMADVVYWTSYHAYYASLGDAEHRGHQIGAREALVAAVGIVGPLAAGWALTVYGPRLAFGAAAVAQALSALPILFTPNVPVAPSAPGALRSALPGTLMFAADGSIQAGLGMVWPIALFVSLGESFTAYGGVMALGALVGAAAGLLLGRGIDLGHGGRAVWLAAGSLALVIGFRAVGYGNPLLAVAANTAGVLTAAYTPALMTAVYNLAKTSPCALRFHIVSEGGWDAGGAASCLISAGLLWAGAPIGAAIGLALVGAACSFVLLQRYYARIETAA